MSNLTTVSPFDKPVRCAWCGDDPLYQAYHDTEWGKPEYDGKRLFALLCLESMQAGLSWITILRRREAYYRAFADFEPQIIATFDDEKVAELLQDASIIRHRGKIEAIINNAKAYLAISACEDFGEYLWRVVRTAQGRAPVDNCPPSEKDVPAQTPASAALAKQLKKDGIKFVGATTCYAFMQR
ncbi:DNA-3-methyladenine glycosylase I, partial [Moraxella caviae]|uniref:DNA-3-methyladenine glycosylase I n=1 Tax=Moraxella caviae TaxID=34060 RepID=UPI00105641A4